MSKPIPAWSHSTLQAFETCPRQYLEIRILKHFEDTKNTAALWGDEFHKVAEQFIGSTCAKLTGCDAATRELLYPQVKATLPPGMEGYEQHFRAMCLRPGRTLVEQKLGLSKSVSPCGFFDKTIWSRGIIDVLNVQDDVANVDDWKTGKRKSDPQQLVIFALMTFAHYAQVNTVHTAYHWIQEGFGPQAQTRQTFTRDQIPALWADLVPKLDRYMRAFKDGIFPPKPSGLCRKFCAVSSCEYWGKGRY